MKKFVMAYILQHPIQYQSPLLRKINNSGDIDLDVVYLSDCSTKTYKDKGFGRSVKWDLDLLEGYKYRFLKKLLFKKSDVSLFKPVVYGVYAMLNERNWDAVWMHGYNHYSLIWAMILCKILKIPFFMRMESNLVGSPKGRFFKDVFIRWIIKNASGLLYVSTDNKNYYMEYKADKNKLFPVPYTVDNSFFQSKTLRTKYDLFSYKQDIGLLGGFPIILYASKLTKRKRSVDLLESYRKLSHDGKTPPNAYLLFIGDGEEKERLKNSIDKLGWNSHIKILGFKNQTELPLYFRMCDIFVLPSQNEPFGLIVNEVMNSAKPVVVTDEVGCAKDIVKDGVNGYVIKVGDIDDLTCKLKKLIYDTELRRKMGDKSLDIIDHWSYSEDIEGLKSALESLDLPRFI